MRDAPESHKARERSRPASPRGIHVADSAHRMQGSCHGAGKIHCSTSPASQVQVPVKARSWPVSPKRPAQSNSRQQGPHQLYQSNATTASMSEGRVKGCHNRTFLQKAAPGNRQIVQPVGLIEPGNHTLRGRFSLKLGVQFQRGGQ